MALTAIGECRIENPYAGERFIVVAVTHVRETNYGHFGLTTDTARDVSAPIAEFNTRTEAEAFLVSLIHLASSQNISL